MAPTGRPPQVVAERGGRDVVNPGGLPYFQAMICYPRECLLKLSICPIPILLARCTLRIANPRSPFCRSVVAEYGLLQVWSFEDFVSPTTGSCRWPSRGGAESLSLRNPSHSATLCDCLHMIGLLALVTVIGPADSLFTL